MFYPSKTIKEELSLLQYVKVENMIQEQMRMKYLIQMTEKSTLILLLAEEFGTSRKKHIPID